MRHIWLLSHHLRARIVCTFLKGWKKSTEYATETVRGSQSPKCDSPALCRKCSLSPALEEGSTVGYGEERRRLGAPVAPRQPFEVPKLPHAILCL